MNVLKNYAKPILTRLNLLLLSASGSVFAESAETTKLAEQAPLSSPTSSALLPMFLGLMVILAMIFLVAWIAKKFNLTPNSAGHFKLVSSMSLGGRERIVIVEVQGKQHAIGVTSQSVNHLFSLEQNIESKPLELTENSLVNKINKLFGYQAPQQHSKSQIKD